MVIRNCVYDVTEYIPYHPGGIPELMKGAGKDATALFNEVHRWVNFDSILRSCLQGYLQIEVGESFDEEETDELSGGSLVPVAAGNRKLVLPETKFSQTDTDLIFHVRIRFRLYCAISLFGNILLILCLPIPFNFRWTQGTKASSRMTTGVSAY